jgi:hypothetical protein
MKLQMVLMVILVLIMVNHCLGQGANRPTGEPSNPSVHVPLVGRARPAGLSGLSGASGPG